MRIHHVLLATGLILSAAPTAVLAEGSSWTLRVHGAIVESSAGGQTSVGSGVVSSIDAGGGFGIGAEYRLTNRLGLELSAMYAELQIDSSVSSRAPGAQFSVSSMMPLSFAVPFHFDVGGRVDFFVAPTISIVHFSDVEWAVSGARVGTRVNVDSDAALGAALGVDIPFGKGKWAFSTGLRYMMASAGETEVDPVIVTLGIAYRF